MVSPFLGAGHRREMFQDPLLATLKEKEEVSNIMACFRTANIKYSFPFKYLIMYQGHIIKKQKGRD